MANPSRIVELSNIIARDTAVVEAFCNKNKIPSPSFELNAPPTVMIPPTEPAVSEAKDNIVAATRELNLLMQGPFQVVTDIGFIDAFAFQAISRFHIADHIPIGSSVSFADLSQRSGVDLRDLQRVLRFAMTNGFFVEPRPGFVAHTSISRMLVENDMFRHGVAFTMEENFPASAKATDALELHPGSEEPTLSGWGIANTAQLPFFSELQARHPSRYIAASTAMDAWNSFIPASPLLTNYDWAPLTTIVDIGGGHGPVSIALAQHFPKPHFIVQDLAGVIADGPATVPVELKGRVEFMEHDMFEPQRVKGADVYFYRSVFHDWPDKYCVKMLQALVPALKKGARVMINDACMPPPGTLAAGPNRAKRQWDMNMMLLFNARDREDVDWAGLFQKADPRFKFLGARLPDKGVEGIPPAWLLSIIEAVWEP